MTPISLVVNGRRVDAHVEPRLNLADFLRDHLRLTGTHIGCEHGVCGACTVMIDGLPARSCLAFAVACDGREVRTIEGFDDDPTMEELRAAFTREHGLQCGFCTPGMMISALDIVQRLPGADETRIRAEMSGNLCRCTGYLGIVRAVHSVAAAPRRAKAAAPAEGGTIPPSTAAPSPPAAAGVAEAGPQATTVRGTRFADSFTVQQPAEIVWAALADFPLIAECLPGAVLTEHSRDTAKGRIAVKMGPITAAFAGSAAVTRDDTAMIAIVKGAGSDAASRSRTRGELSYRVIPGDDDRSCRVEVAVEYDLQGPLAQFSRSGLAQDVGRRLVGEFAQNLNRRLDGSSVEAAPASVPIKIAPLLWQALLARLRRLVQRRAS